jgi:serine protease Do
MFAGIAAALALASGAAVAAGSLGQEPGKPQVWVSKDGDLAGLEPDVRHLAVLAGRGSQLGVSVRDLDAEQARAQSGAVVEEVRDGSAAAKAGIQKGDVITEFDGERVRGVRHLTRLVSETPDGRTVKAAVVREGRRVDLSVTPDSGSLAAFERTFDVLVPPMRFEGPLLEGGPDWSAKVPDGAWAFKGRPGDVFGFRSEKGRLGLRIQSLDGQLGEYFGTTKGVLVNAVDADSAAAKAGLKAGDVVTAINGTAVAEPSDLIDAVREAEDGATLTIDYVRDRKAQSTRAVLPSEDKVETKPRRRVSPI